MQENNLLQGQKQRLIDTDLTVCRTSDGELASISMVCYKTLLHQKQKSPDDMKSSGLF